MPAALVVFINVLFIAFVLVAVVGLCASSIVADRPVADQRARLWAAVRPRAQRRTAPARRRPRRALDLGA